MKLTIMYWNIGGSKPCAALALANPREVDIIAIQEPWRNNHIKGATYCPRAGKYTVIYAGGRAALYVHKRHGVTTWTQEAHNDWCSVTFGTGDDSLTIYSVYSPVVEGRTWESPITVLAEREPQGRNVVVGDVNLHHPLWDRWGRYQQQSEELLTLAQRWNLTLHTPWGEPTREARGDRPSTIDQAWVSRRIRCEYRGRADITGSDHYPQLIYLCDEATTTQPRAPPEGWSWPMMDRSIVKAEAVHIACPQTISTPDELDQAADELVAQLTRIADASTPRRKANYGHGSPW